MRGALVGAGGLGSQIGQAFTHLGIGQIVWLVRLEKRFASRW